MPVVKIKGIPVEMGGATWIVPPLSLGALEQLQERMAAFTGDVFDKTQVATAVDAAHAALLRNYPGVTREEVAGMIDVANMADVFQAVMDVSGARRKAAEQAAAKEGAAPGEA